MGWKLIFLFSHTLQLLSEERKTKRHAMPGAPHQLIVHHLQGETRRVATELDEAGRTAAAAAAAAAAELRSAAATTAGPPTHCLPPGAAAAALAGLPPNDATGGQVLARVFRDALPWRDVYAAGAGGVASRR